MGVRRIQDPTIAELVARELEARREARKTQKVIILAEVRADMETASKIARREHERLKRQYRQAGPRPGGKD